jgi:rod shape-determining protein MreC
VKKSKYLTYLVLLLTAVALTLPLPASIRVKIVARDGVAPFQNIVSMLIYGASEKWRIMSDADSAIEERGKLMEELAELRLQVNNMDAVGLENDRLRGMLAFKKRDKRRLLTCEIIARGDASGWWQTVTINKGGDDGVKPDMAVITMDGLVGRTRKEAARYSCDVLLITDPTARIGCRLKRSGAPGIVSGAGVAANGDQSLAMLSAIPVCRLDYVDKSADIIDNEEVITSGLGGVYPEGILVGFARKSALDSSGLFRRSEVTPAADLRNMRFVFVVLE